jgi:hypothetical protein
MHGTPLDFPKRTAHNVDMPNRSSKQKQDFVENAFRVMREATGEAAKTAQPEPPKKNPAAVELGRLGGLKGGKARAAKLSARKRQQIARKAAISRWRKS